MTAREIPDASWEEAKQIILNRVRPAFGPTCEPTELVPAIASALKTKDSRIRELEERWLRNGDILSNKNFQYCVMFLKNAGERVRAMRLVLDVTTMPSDAVKEWVDKLTWRDAEIIIKPMSTDAELLKEVKNP